ITVMVLLVAPLRIGHERTPNAILFIVGVLLILPLIWRRRYPLTVFGCIAGIAAVQWMFARAVVSDVALLVALYTVAAYRDQTRALIALGALEFGILIAVARWAPSEGVLKAFIFLSGMAVAAFVLGRNMRTRRAYLASLEDRAGGHARAAAGNRSDRRPGRSGTRRRVADFADRGRAAVHPAADGATRRLSGDSGSADQCAQARRFAEWGEGDPALRRSGRRGGSRGRRPRGRCGAVAERARAGRDGRTRRDVRRFGRGGS